MSSLPKGPLSEQKVSGATADAATAPLPAPPRPPRICTRLTALGGSLRYCVVAYRPLTYAEATAAIATALEQGWIQEPPLAAEAVVYTSIGSAPAIAGALAAERQASPVTVQPALPGQCTARPRASEGRRGPPPLGLERFIDPGAIVDSAVARAAGGSPRSGPHRAASGAGEHSVADGGAVAARIGTADAKS